MQLSLVAFVITEWGMTHTAHTALALALAAHKHNTAHTAHTAHTRTCIASGSDARARQ